MMRKFITTPHTEVIGISALAVMQNLKAEELQPILAKYDLTSVEPDQWYPFQLHLDIFREIAGQSNSGENLVAIGLKAAEVAPVAPDIKTFADLLKNYNASYHMTIRNQPPEEGFLIEFLGEGHAQITNNSPLPDDMTFGAFWGFAKRFLPPGTHFLIRPLKRVTPDSDESTVFDVIWQEEVIRLSSEVKTDSKNFIAVQNS